MKIEDLHFGLPDAVIDEKNFDLEKWRNENPMNYLKALYVVLQSDIIVDDLPSEIARATAFHTVYKVSRLYIPEILYKYGSLTDDEEMNEKKFQTLRSRLIFMSESKGFNDPFDGKALYYDPEMLKSIERLSSHDGRLIDDFTLFHRAASLTANGVNCMPMWAHYSNNHHGFCVSYNMKHPDNLKMSSCTFPIQYTSQRLDITSFMKEYAQKLNDEVNLQLSKGKKQVLVDDLSLVYVSVLLSNIKHVSWEYEKEFSCTMASNATGTPYVKATPQAIYIGMKCQPGHEKRLRRIAQELQIPAYKMTFEDRAETFELIISM